MCILTPDMVFADKMRMSESSQNSAARLWVNLILDQCLQNKAFATDYFLCAKMCYYNSIVTFR